MQSVTKLILIVPESTPIETIHRIVTNEGFSTVAAHEQASGKEYNHELKLRKFIYEKPTNPKP